MKLLLATFFFLSSITSISLPQTKSGEIMYKVVLLEVDTSNESMPVGYNQFKRGIDNAARELRFRLIFSQTKSLFGMAENLFLHSKNLNYKAAKIILHGKEKYYSNSEEGFLIEQIDFLNEPFRIKTNFKDLKWKLTKASKQIGIYTCYKAVSYRTSTNRNFEKTKKDIYAWYCPELPLNFGPFESVGLPGLVLQFDAGEYSWVAEEINFDTKHLIEVPRKGKLITRQEFDNIVKGMAKKEMND